MNKKKFLLLFILCCGLPLLAAKLILEMGWFNSGASSQGQWQQAEVFLLSPTPERAHWRLAVTPATDCQQLCQQALYTVQQLYIGLGRKQEQVQPVLLGKTTTPAEYTVFANMAPRESVPVALQDRILLIDQQGLVLLSYPMPLAEADMAPTAKAIRKDLLKLLNYDRTSV
jgi:hypothetical protein